MTTTREPREASRHERRDSHGRRPHSSSRSRREDPSPRRWRDDRRHESDRSQYRRRAEENAKAGDLDERKKGPLEDAAQHDDPSRAEGKRLSDAKENPPARRERSPRGTKRFSETREAWRPRSFFQHDARNSAGQGSRRYDRQEYGRQRNQAEHFGDGDKHRSEGHGLQEKVEQVQQQNDVDSTWKHDGFFQLEEEAPVAKRRPGFKEMRMPLEKRESAPSVADPDSRSREFISRDDRGTRRGFSDHRNAGQRNGYDSRGRFAARGGRGRDRFNNQYGGGNNMYEPAGDQAEKWKHDLFDQTNSTPTPMTEEEQIAKVEALLAL